MQRNAMPQLHRLSRMQARAMPAVRLRDPQGASFCRLAAHPSVEELNVRRRCERQTDSKKRNEMSVADMEVGQSAVVASIEEAPASTIRRLLSLGVMPGECLILEQKSPAFIVRVGWTQVALGPDSFAVQEGP